MSQFTEFSQKTKNPNHPDVWDVTPQDVFTKKNDLCIIDVRRPDEYTDELKHIAGSRLVVLDTLPQNIQSLPKDKTIVFVCRSGGRSGRASQFALASGFSSVYNMQGGMILWNDLNLPTEG